jgi:hypothetical protein
MNKFFVRGDGPTLLNEAMKIAVRGTVDFLVEQKMVPMSREEAYALIFGVRQPGCRF